MGAYSGVGACLSSSGSEVGAYSGGGLFESAGLIDHLRYVSRKCYEEKHVYLLLTGEDLC